MHNKLVNAVVGLLVLTGVASAAASAMQDEDRPVIIISSGSVILNVSKGSWVREAPGRFRQELARGRDVRTFSATTGSGASACTVEGEALQVRYGANAISFGRQAGRGQGAQRRAALIGLPERAVVRERDERTLEIETTDPLSVVTNGKTDCTIVAGRVEVRQVH